jgi:uroporphyrinogen decarboxylase
MNLTDKKSKSVERVFTALKGGIPDRVPMFEFLIDAKVIKAINKDYDYFDFVEAFELDAVRVGQQYVDYKDRCTLIDPEKQIIRDFWGIERQFTGEIHWFPISSPIKTKADFEKFTPPDPRGNGVLGRLPEIVRRFKGKKAIIYALNDSFSIPGELRGLENLLMDYIDNPDFARAVTDMAVDYSIVEVQRAIDAGAEIIMLRDDYAYKSGPIMSPGQFREFVLPGLSRIVRAIKEKGAFVVKHCDGNIWDILDMIVETGVDAINPLEPVAGMEISEVKKKYGDKVCLIGNIDCGDLLCLGRPEDVEKEVIRCIRAAGGKGGFILSSSNSISSAVNPENFLKMIEAGKKYGKYPLIF